MLISVLTRRQLLARLAGFLAAATGAGLSGCRGEHPDVDPDTLKAMLDTFIPADEDPGALQAGVFEIIIERIRGNRVTLQRYARLLPRINEHAAELYGAPFKRLPLPQRDEMLSSLYHSTGIELAQLRIDLNTALKHCFHAFYSSPAAERVIGYHPPIEGGYPGYAGPPAPRPREY